MALSIGGDKRVISNSMVIWLKTFLILATFWRENLEADAAVAKNSSPFDPFRLECPFFHGIIRLDLQRVESQEGVRTDTMITSFCENIKKLFPSPRDPTLTTADESCRWTSNFHIPGETFDFTDTCEGKEFVSGISRQALGEYGILCCKLKDRKKGDCSTVEFTLPTVTSPSVEIERGKRILTAIGQEKGRLVAQFCQLEIMSRKEIDEEFIANAKARLLSRGEEDKVRVPINKAGGIEVDGDGPVRAFAQPPTSRPSRPSPPGIRPPVGFTPARGRGAVNRPPPSPPQSDDDDDNDDNAAPKKASKTVEASNNNVQRLASIRNGNAAPAIQAPGRRPPTSKKPSNNNRNKIPTTITSDDSKEDEITTPKSRKPPTKIDDDKSKSQEDDDEAPATKSPTTKISKLITTTEVVEPATDEVVLPDPARFQVLGIPRPLGSPSLLKPKSALIESASEADQSEDPGSFGGTISAGGSVKNSEKLTSLPPAPPVKHEITLPPIEDQDEENSPYPSPTTPKSPEQEQSGDKEEGFAAPVLKIGNLGAASNGIVINPQNGTVESAVAPAKGLFTVLPPPPKFVVKSDGDKKLDGGLGAAIGVIDEFTTQAITLPTTTGIQRLECETISAWRDPQSGLVLACGQGDEIWTPGRCQPGMLCLLAKDSSFRLCCRVHVG